MIVPRRRWESLGEVVLCSGFPTQLAFTLLAVAAGLRPLSGDGALSLPFVAVVSAADTVALAILILLFLHRRGESPRSLFLGPRPPAGEVGLGLLLVPVILIFISLTIWGLGILAPSLRTVPDNPFGKMAATPVAAFTLAAVAVVAGGFREEMQRAFLLHRFRADLGGIRPGLLLTSVAFGLGHVQQGWDAVVVTALLGAFWGLLFLVRSGIIASVVSHGAANAAQVVVAYLQHQG